MLPACVRKRLPAGARFASGGRRRCTGDCRHLLSAVVWQWLAGGIGGLSALCQFAAWLRPAGENPSVLGNCTFCLPHGQSGGLKICRQHGRSPRMKICVCDRNRQKVDNQFIAFRCRTMIGVLMAYACAVGFVKSASCYGGRPIF